MYNSKIINELITSIESHNGINDKKELSNIIQKKFSLVKDRSVFTCDAFSIRFSKSKERKLGNTILSLSNLQKYDNKPFILCVVCPVQNYLLLANTTFLKKISHSSKELRINNIRGSFNGTDIIYDFNGISNSPSNFEELYAYHEGFSFQDNLERLVEATNNIVGRVKKFNITDESKPNIFDSIQRTKDFIKSKYYEDLLNDLNTRVENVKNEIAIASLIDNVNIRGRIIEYLITDNGSTLKEQIIKALNDKSPLPQFKTDDKLGDYSKVYPTFNTETDIKTKVLFLKSNPKAYNIDKLLEFLSNDKSIYMIYLIGVDENANITSRLCSIYDTRLIKGTHFAHQWAGRNSRGVAQFIGKNLTEILTDISKNIIYDEEANNFISMLMDK